MLLRQIVWVALGGAFGSLARWGLATAVKSQFGQHLPWGTAAVNILGSFLFGLVWAATEGRTGLGPVARLALLTGFMGAFTTFSTYLFDTATLIQQGRHGAAIGQVAVQIALGLAGVFLGLSLGKTLAPS